MPEPQYAREYEAQRQKAAQGGAMRWRTLKLPSGRYIHLAVTRKAGPRGGHTVAGPVRTKVRGMPRSAGGEAPPIFPGGPGA